MPTSTRRRLPLSAVCAALVVIAGACTNPSGSGETGVAPDGLVALVARGDDTSLVGWDASGGRPTPIKLPKGDVVWVATGLQDVLAAVRADGTSATSDPVVLGSPLTWRNVEAKDPSGNSPAGPSYFAAWEPDGGRYAMLAGDLLAGEDIRVVLVDPALSTAFEIALDQPAVAAPPVWIDDDRLVVVTGDAGAPIATIVDPTSGDQTEGPSGDRLLATSADGKRIATMAEQGAPIIVRDMAGWLAGDGSSIASIEPPNGSTTAITFALDTQGERLAVAWAAANGSVTLAVHDGGSGWRRTSKPDIGSAKGAVVAWRR
ncbi:MAG: hypothetical protein ACJ776_10335 [Chloroflexota bacterium]